MYLHANAKLGLAGGVKATREVLPLPPSGPQSGDGTSARRSRCLGLWATTHHPRKPTATVRVAVRSRQALDRG
jgi:hypothetical protein